MGGDLSRRVNEFAAIRRYTGASIFAFDYAGFGRSPGKASVRNTAIDARAARAHLQKRYGANMESVLYLGVSLGAAVAVRLAAEGPSPAGIALVAPFASLRDMGRLLYPALTLGGRLAGGRFDSLAHIGRIGCPLLILHGADDALVPAAQGRKLYAAARPPRQFAECPGVGHDNIGDAPEFWAALCGWVDNLAAAGAGTPLGCARVVKLRFIIVPRLFSLFRHPSESWMRQLWKLLCSWRSLGYGFCRNGGGYDHAPLMAQSAAIRRPVKWDISPLPLVP